jgi:EpsI family protein
MDRGSLPATIAVKSATKGSVGALGVVLGMLFLTAIVYWPTTREIVSRWDEYHQYTHGWMVLVLSIWLLWTDRNGLQSQPILSPRGGWLVVAVAGLAWFVAYTAGILAGSMVMLPVLALSAVWAVGGNRLAVRAATPVLLLYFTIPGWEVLNPALQKLTAFVVTAFTGLLGIPVVMGGYVIHIPEGSFIVEDACSGLKFLVVALIVAVVQGELERHECRSRCRLVLLAVAAALIANWARVFIVIVAGHVTDMKSFLITVDHYYFGWALFAATLFIYFRLAKRITRSKVPPVDAEDVSREMPVGISGAAMVLTVLALMVWPMWLGAKALGSRHSSYVVEPPVLSGWLGPTAEASAWQPSYANADEQFVATYRDLKGGEATLFSASYHGQRQGKELLDIGNSVLGDGYSPQQVHRTAVDAGGRTIEITEYRAGNLSRQRLLVWSIYAVDGEPDSMNFISQLQFGLRSILHTPTASVIAIAAPCGQDCESARVLLRDLAAAALPVILRDLGRESVRGSAIASEPQH